MSSALTTQTPSLSELPTTEKNIAETSRPLFEQLQVLEDHLPESYPAGPKFFAIVAALVLSVFLSQLDLTIVATAIPHITDEFHSLDDVGWYGSAFFLTFASFLSTWGKVYKYFNLKRAFLVGIGVFELGSLVCAVAPSSAAFIVGRAIAGIGGGSIGSGVYTIIAFTVPPTQRPAYTGIIGATFCVASVVGPLLGGVCTDKLTEQIRSFYINLPIGGVAAAIIFVLFHLPEAAKPTPATWREKLLQMDPLGTLTIMGAVICFLLALQYGGVTYPWSSSVVIGLLVGFGLLVIAFIVIEWRMGERALLIPRLFRQRTFTIAAIYIFLFGGAFFLLVYFVPIYFQCIDNVSAAESGIRSVPLILGVAIFTILSGHLISLFGHFVPLMLGGAALATVGAGMIYTWDIGSSSAQWIGYQAIAGIGIGIGCQIPISAGQAMVDMQDIAPATAMILFFQTCGGAFFISAGQSIFTNQLIRSLALTAPSVDPTLVVSTGATDLQQVFSPDVLPGIVRAYMDGLKGAYALAIPLLGIPAVVSVFAEWKSIKGTAAPAPAA